MAILYRAAPATVAISILLAVSAAAQGGIRQTANGRGMLVMGAESAVTLTAAPDQSDPAIAVGTEIVITPESAALPANSTLVLHWHPDDLPGGVYTGDMRPVRWDGSDWRAVKTISQGTDSAAIPVTAGGRYALRWVGPATRCTGTAYQALDFRLGKWNYSAPGYDPGLSIVIQPANRCALQDKYEDVKGGKSQAFMVYAPADGHWYITTYDPGGRSVMQGTATKDAVAFYHSPTDREVYRRQADGTITFTGERSSDGGQSWTAWVSALYRRFHEE